MEEILNKYLKVKEELIEILLNVTTFEEMEESLKILSEQDLLPRGGWCHDCPNFIRHLQDKDNYYFDRYATYDFLELIEYAVENSEVGKRLSKEGVKRYYRYLIIQTFRYVRQTKRIGFKFDW